MHKASLWYEDAWEEGAGGDGGIKLCAARVE